MATRITAALGAALHTQALGGAMPVPGSPAPAEVTLVALKPSVIFRLALSDHSPFDVAEMSLANAWMLADKGDQRFVAIPVFPSRMFRWSALYVRADRPSPGAFPSRVGSLRYGQTAAVWARDLLCQEFGMPFASLQHWAGEPSPVSTDGASVQQAAGMSGLERMLAGGELDALIATSMPAAYHAGQARRLFADWAERELAALRDGEATPIMHCVLVRRSLAMSAPELRRALVARLYGCRDRALAQLTETDISSLPLPGQQAWATLASATPDPQAIWPYGLEANRAVLSRFARIMFEQGLTSRLVDPAEVFPIIDDDLHES